MDKSYFRKLRCRRVDVEKTLRYIEIQRLTVERNAEWVDQAAYEARINLLDRLTAGYQNERHRIDDALNRWDPTRYGLCLVCHEPIEIERLQISPETQFCIDCQPAAKGSQSAEPSILERFIPSFTRQTKSTLPVVNRRARSRPRARKEAQAKHSNQPSFFASAASAEKSQPPVLGAPLARQCRDSDGVLTEFHLTLHRRFF